MNNNSDFNAKEGYSRFAGDCPGWPDDESKWKNLANQKRYERVGDKLIIHNPLGWAVQLGPEADTEFGNGLGWQQYGEVAISQICVLREESMGHFLGSINSAMKIDAKISVQVLPVVDNYRTWYGEVIGIMRGKGFRHVERHGEWIWGVKCDI